MKDFSGFFHKLLNKFLISNGSMNFSQKYLSIVSYPKQLLSKTSKYSVSEVASVFKAAAQKNDIGTEAKTEGM